MSTYDFNNINDCQAFIGLILDNYCPKQLEGIDAILLGDAIRSCKENGYELTGNQIYYECCVIATNNLILRLEDIKKYELDDFEELTSYEFNCVENFLNNTEQIEKIFDWYCNGSLDSSIFLNIGIITSEDRIAIRKINEFTECFADFQDEIGGYVKNLDELLECEIEFEVNEPDICD